MNTLRTTTLITGAAGFVGFHLAVRLLEAGGHVVGLDNLNSYYDTKLKTDRLAALRGYERFIFAQEDIAVAGAVDGVFREHAPTTVIHLAAQAGVRYSLENPDAYIQSNLVGFANVLEACRRHKVHHLLYASSSSVYGGNAKVPFAEDDPVEHPVSLYAATKRSNELMADSYSHLYGIPSTALRFFTVYGPWGRPDMAYFSFANKHFSGQPIRLFNRGQSKNDLSRDFTYIDDVVETVTRLIDAPPSGPRPHRILNVGGSRPVSLTKFVETLEEAFSCRLGREVEFAKVYEGPKPGDVPATYADATRLRQIIGYVPETSLSDGLRKFAEWYVSYYEVDG